MQRALSEGSHIDVERRILGIILDVEIEIRHFAMGNDGHIVNAILLDCVNDNAAIESAKQLVNRRDLELWQRDRLIAKFDRTPE
jgi:hypothetical protein